MQGFNLLQIMPKMIFLRISIFVLINLIQNEISIINFIKEKWNKTGIFYGKFTGLRYYGLINNIFFNLSTLVFVFVL